MKYNRLEGLREENDLKSKEVAKDLGVVSSAYSEWEHNKVRIPTKRLIELANYYEVNIDYLMCLTNIRYHIKSSDINLENIGLRIKSIRNELGYSLRELGKELEISFSSISNYENGKNLIQSDILLSLSKMSNCSIDYILNRTNKKYID